MVNKWSVRGLNPLPLTNVLKKYFFLSVTIHIIYVFDEIFFVYVSVLSYEKILFRLIKKWDSYAIVLLILLWDML
jgi:hypothetical protein